MRLRRFVELERERAERMELERTAQQRVEALERNLNWLDPPEVLMELDLGIDLAFGP